MHRLKNLENNLRNLISSFSNQSVWSTCHPSLEAHYIEWIVLVTEIGFQMKWLKPSMKPEAVFKIMEKPVAAYEYCNLHGLWKAEA